MSKLPKRVEYPYTEAQAWVTPDQRRTPPSREQVIAFLRNHERMTWSLSKLIESDWRSIDLDVLTEVDLWVVETTMLVESNSPNYTASLLDYFQADQDVCDFLAMWTVEEWKHYYALRDYLTKARTALELRRSSGADDVARLESLWTAADAALSDDVDSVRSLSQENWGIPQHYVPAQVTAATSLQEFITADFYRSHAEATQEPVLAQLEQLLAKDEVRHEMFYEARVFDCVEREPDHAELVVEALKEFAMPGAFVLEDYDERRAQMEQAAFPTLSSKLKAFRRVFGKVARMVGEDNAMRVFTEGNYMTDGVSVAGKSRPRPETITRLMVSRI